MLKLKTGLLVGFLVLLESCMIAPQTKSFLERPSNIPQTHEIQNVEFFPQEAFYCGPTTLAEALNFYDIEVKPEEVAPSLFIPGREGSLQIEMVSSARRYGLLAYAETTTIERLLSLVSENIPVIVLQNLGTSWYPRWHYALVIGYDLQDETVMLHTGLSERRVASMELFENTWRRGDYWMLVAIPPQKTSQYLDPFLYVRAAQDLMEVNQEAAALAALESATQQWRDYWLSYLLLGNHYLDDEPQLALSWYDKGADTGSDKPSFLNNYAYALLRNGYKARALDKIQTAVAIEPDNLRLQNSLAEIRRAQ